MSVINQMLKELEERNDPKANISNTRSTQQHKQNSSKLKVTLIILLIIVINVCGLYAWGLYSENKALKTAAHTSSQTLLNEKTDKDNSLTLTQKQSSEVVMPHVNKIEKTPILANKNTANVEQEYVEQLVSQPLGEKVVQKTVNELKILENKEAQQTFKQDNVVITPLHDSINGEGTLERSKADSLVLQEKQPSLSISRSKLSPERVIQNKLEKAEQAIIDNDIPKAEKLFEDILLIQSDHKSARKQLSALWFGRKLFRPALNLLSQGMAIYPDDVDFRLMKARIFLHQDNKKEALHILNGFAEAPNIEYQVLLASTAQSLGNSNSVILAYRQLVELEPHKSKRWMGLAVALDRNSQFKKAKTAYEMALSIGNLSSNSAKFIRQRMSELGEY